MLTVDNRVDVYYFAATKRSIVELFTVAINELLCMKNAGAQIAMDFS